MRLRAYPLFVSIAFLLTANAAAEDRRIVTLGSSVTETVFALGLGNQVLARDTSSTHPPEAEELPAVGYYRQIAAEGVLAQNPTLILTTSDAGPPEALDQLRQAGATLVVVPEKKTIAGARKKIELIADTLGVPEHGEQLLETFDQHLAEARKMSRKRADTPKVLFLMNLDGAGAALAAGSGTGVQEMLREAGAQNVAREIEGYRDLSAEAILAANPEVVLIPDHLAGGEVPRGLLEPLLSQTRAWKSDRIYTVDLAALAGFGPRAGQALANLVRKIYPAQETKVDS